MLGWVKDKIGRKQTALEALVANQFKDAAEKQSALEALAQTEGLKPEELIALLAHPDQQILQRGSVLFLTRATPAGVSALIESVFAVEAADRALLMKTLIRVKADMLRQAMDVELKDAKQDRLRSAWELAMELPPEVSDAYVERALKEGPPRARADALKRMLAKRSVEDLRPTLIGCLEDREPRVRRMAVDSLVQLQGNDIFEAMLDRVATDDNPDIRKVAGGYLQKFISSAPAEMRPTILGRLLLSGDADVRSQLVKAIFATAPAYELLLEILTFSKTVLGVQHQAILDSLMTLGEGLCEHAVRVLANDDPDLRIQAILLLERYPSPRTTQAMVRLVEDADWWVRIMACDALGRLKDPRTLPVLSRLLGDPECKWAAIDAIGSVGGDAGLQILVGLRGDPQVEVRLAVVKAIGLIDDPRVDGYIEESAKSDASLDIRIRAVELLRERRGAKAAGGEAQVSSAHLTRPMEKLFAYAREARASDLHVTPEEPPFLRVNGVIERIKTKPLARAQVDALIDDILDPVRRPILQEKGSVDFCYAIPGVGRYRVNCFRQMRGTSCVVRVIPNVPPTLADCGLPQQLEEVGVYHQGVILITGAAGCGKSTTLTAIVNLLNETRNTHILSLEDPIEFLHTPKRALINQREIGRDSRSFAAAMRGALREDPDIIVVGELRDKETIRLAMIAAETGHLVIATMQTTGAIATVDKVVESFPADEQAQIRVQFAGSVKLIVSQVLVPKANGNGRAAAFELLKATPPVCAIIRDGKTFQLGSAMQIGRTQGMLTLDASLEGLLVSKQISLETALAYAQKKETFLKAARAGQAASPEGEATEEAAPPSSFSAQLEAELTGTKGKLMDSKILNADALAQRQQQQVQPQAYAPPAQQAREVPSRMPPEAPTQTSHASPSRIPPAAPAARPGVHVQARPAQPQVVVRAQAPAPDAHRVAPTQPPAAPVAQPAARPAPAPAPAAAAPPAAAPGAPPGPAKRPSRSRVHIHVAPKGGGAGNAGVPGKRIIPRDE
jgi:twitching motility protein PilT